MATPRRTLPKIFTTGSASIPWRSGQASSQRSHSKARADGLYRLERFSEAGTAARRQSQFRAAVPLNRFSASFAEFFRSVTALLAAVALPWVAIGAHRSRSPGPPLRSAVHGRRRGSIWKTGLLLFESRAILLSAFSGTASSKSFERPAREVSTASLFPVLGSGFAPLSDGAPKALANGEPVASTAGFGPPSDQGTGRPRRVSAPLTRLTVGRLSVLAAALGLGRCQDQFGEFLQLAFDDAGLPGIPVLKLGDLLPQL